MAERARSATLREPVPRRQLHPGKDQSQTGSAVAGMLLVPTGNLPQGRAISPAANQNSPEADTNLRRERTRGATRVNNQVDGADPNG